MLIQPATIVLFGITTFAMFIVFFIVKYLGYADQPKNSTDPGMHAECLTTGFFFLKFLHRR